MGVRRLGPQVASVALTILVCFLATHSTPTADAQTIPTKPNFVFILADDMRKDELEYMPITRSLLGDRGMTFANAYVSYGLCCPSRATIMRGQYAHNTGVWTNDDGPDGGWQGYKANGNEQDNMATRLDAAGYRTGLFGKYFNHYEGATVPPGWDRWFATYGFDYFEYWANDNGTMRRYGTDESDYQTDVLSRQTRGFIRTAQGTPFFAYVAPIAPHTGVPAPRDEHAFDGETSPRLPSFNEENVSDKPRWIRSLPRLDDAAKAKMNDRHEKRVETLQALDDLVSGVVRELKESGQVNNTYIVFTSDNGNHLGEHRIPKGKAQPYEESISMPLLIRGPGVAAGSSTAKLALNTDYLPTLTDLAGIQTPGYVDGRSLRPVIEGGSTTSWRSAILLERAVTYNHPYPGPVPAEALSGILTSEGRKYVEYEGGVRELYNLGTDPYELTNKYAGTPPASLASRLTALKSCSGDSCRAAEDGP
jgi:N-acetylglucosamine-6-sulfatase